VSSDRGGRLEPEQALAERDGRARPRGGERARLQRARVALELQVARARGDGAVVVERAADEHGARARDLLDRAGVGDLRVAEDAGLGAARVRGATVELDRCGVVDPRELGRGRVEVGAGLEPDEALVAQTVPVGELHRGAARRREAVDAQCRAGRDGGRARADLATAGPRHRAGDAQVPREVAARAQQVRRG